MQQFYFFSVKRLMDYVDAVHNGDALDANIPYLIALTRGLVEHLPDDVNWYFEMAKNQYMELTPVEERYDPDHDITIRIVRTCIPARDFDGKEVNPVQYVLKYHGMFVTGWRLAQEDARQHKVTLLSKLDALQDLPARNKFEEYACQLDAYIASVMTEYERMSHLLKCELGLYGEALEGEFNPMILDWKMLAV